MADVAGTESLLLEYGCDPTGKRECSAQINAAINDAANQGLGELPVPPGTFLFGEPLVLRSGVALTGFGPASTLRQAPGANLSPAITATSITDAGLRRLSIDYNCQNNPSSFQGMSIGQSGGGSCSFVDVIGCTFLNSLGFAIAFAGGPGVANTHCTIARNQILNPLSGSDDMVLAVVNAGLVYGNRIIGTDTNIALVLYECSHMNAFGNEVELASGSTGSGISVLSCQYATVALNKVIGPGTANGTAYVIGQEHDNTNPGPSQRNLLLGNTAFEVGTGIQLFETGYDRIIRNTIDQAGTGFQLPPNLTIADFEIVEGNALLNVSVPFANDSGSIQLYSRYRDNYGLNPIAVTTPAIPAPSTSITNTTTVDVDVYIAGFTGADISLNGTATGQGGGTFYLPAGGAIDLGAYTAAGAWVWVGR